MSTLQEKSKILWESEVFARNRERSAGRHELMKFKFLKVWDFLTMSPKILGQYFTFLGQLLFTQLLLKQCLLEVSQVAEIEGKRVKYNYPTFLDNTSQWLKNKRWNIKQKIRKQSPSLYKKTFHVLSTAPHPHPQGLQVDILRLPTPSCRGCETTGASTKFTVNVFKKLESLMFIIKNDILQFLWITKHRYLTEGVAN